MFKDRDGMKIDMLSNEIELKDKDDLCQPPCTKHSLTNSTCKLSIRAENFEDVSCEFDI